MASTPGKYFAALTFTMDVPSDHNLDEELLEHLFRQFHEPTPELMQHALDFIDVETIVEEGRVTAFIAKLLGLVSYELTAERVLAIEAYVNHLVDSVKASLPNDKRYTIGPYLAFHRDYT